MERLSPDGWPPGERVSESEGVFRGSDGFDFGRIGHESFGSDTDAHRSTVPGKRVNLGCWFARLATSTHKYMLDHTYTMAMH